MTHDASAKRFVERVMHDAHLRYQRQQLRPETQENYVSSLPCPEQRGCHEDRRHHIKQQTWQSEWTTGLRPNFWKAYFDTLSKMG